MYLRLAHPFHKPDQNVKPGMSQHKNNYSEMKKKRQEECERRCLGHRRKRMWIILLPAKQSQCQLSNAIVSPRETLQHGAAVSLF